ncbi:MAG: hypothetical protein NTY32_13275, partial [Bacteroidia bacterium]|nr:hypothetical protein [Bacteroidia bacterium]
MRVSNPLIFVLSLALALPVAARGKSKPVVSAPTIQTPTLSENDRRVSDYFFQEALNARQQNRFDDAFELFRYVVEMDSLNAQAWYEVAVFYNNMKHPEWGVDAMERAWRLDPQNDWYTFGLANMYLALKMAPKAVVLYEGLLKTRSSDENLHYQLAALYNQSGNFQAALGQFDAVENLIGKNEAVSFEK